MKSKIINRVRERQRKANFRKFQEDVRNGTRPDWLEQMTSKKIEEIRQRRAVRLGY